jgi:hypothetical protein
VALIVLGLWGVSVLSSLGRRTVVAAQATA